MNAHHFGNRRVRHECVTRPNRVYRQAVNVAGIFIGYDSDEGSGGGGKGGA